MKEKVGVVTGNGKKREQRRDGGSKGNGNRMREWRGRWKTNVEAKGKRDSLEYEGRN